MDDIRIEKLKRRAKLQILEAMESDRLMVTEHEILQEITGVTEKICLKAGDIVVDVEKWSLEYEKLD